MVAQNTFKTNYISPFKTEIILAKPMAVSRKEGEIYFNLAFVYYTANIAIAM